MSHLVVETPLGPVTLTERDGALAALRFGAQAGGEATPLLQRAAAQLDEYFAGKRKDFDLPLAPAGGDFERSVWAALQRIPYGATVTYGQLARAIGASAPAAARAVGQACGANPLPIIVPCHRVLSAAGSGGFSAPGGLDTKYKLLCHEGAALL